MERTRAERRFNTYVWVERKKQGAIANGMIGFYEVEGKLRKGKNFCSCSLCTPKTNNRGKTYFGYTKIRYKRYNWSAADKKKVDSCTYSLSEYTG